MLKFSTAESRYSFEVDGKPYTLNALTLDSLDHVKAILAADDKSVQGDMIVDFLEKQSDKRTMTAIRKLPIKDIGVLFQDWAGIVQPAVTPGESEGSPES